MKWQRYGLASVVMAGLLTLAMACTAEGAPPANNTSSPNGGGSQVTIGDGVGASAALSTESLSALGSALSYPYAASSGTVQAGIYVTGTGKVTVMPDLARLLLGVETRAETVQAAQAEAAAAMSAIVQVLRDAGLTDRDIQTRYFNIYPEYNYYDRDRVLTGYRVSNSVTALVRDLDGLGEIIDDVAVAGGDATRIDGITFTVEEPARYQSQAREAAVIDALAKAQQFATLTGVGLGKLAFITESGGGTPMVRTLDATMAFAEGAPAAVTPISAGELEILVQVQAVFGVE